MWMSMMFEDRDAYAVAELEARKAIGELDPSLVVAQKGVRCPGDVEDSITNDDNRQSF
jgi:hypothetical protein